MTPNPSGPSGTAPKRRARLPRLASSRLLLLPTLCLSSRAQTRRGWLQLWPGPPTSQADNNALTQDDQSPVSVFSYDLSSPSHVSTHDRRALFPLARTAFRKLRALRHPNILKFLDGAETDSSVWFVTEPVTSLALDLDDASEESKVYGLLHVCTALAFLNREGQSVHGGLRTTSVWVTPGGEWKLGGMEVLTKLDEPDGAMWVRHSRRPSADRSGPAGD